MKLPLQYRYGWLVRQEMLPLRENAKLDEALDAEFELIFEQFLSVLEPAVAKWLGDQEPSEGDVRILCRDARDEIVSKLT